MFVLLAIYYITPFLRWDRGEHAPSQAVLIDLTHTRAYFFGIEIWPQEVYYITAILIVAAVGLFFVTSLLGRVWCGYACPQTVWTDLFILVERLVQGDRNARKKLDESPLTFTKLFKKLTTHFIWLLIALVTGGAWVFYFNDAYTLIEQIRYFEVPSSVYVWILGLTFSTYLMAGYAREQVCTYMCPYSRFQSAMFDDDTLIITYDEKRGEPRAHHKQGTSWDNKGHCIDCNSCVVVCPMGIDIREGLQMECIACGLCVDACNDVMDKVGLPKGLIRYDTQNAKRQNIKPKLNLLRPRSIFYAVILLAVTGFALYSLLSRKDVAVSVNHDRNPLFVKLSDGSIRNGYNITILNKSHSDQIYILKVVADDEYEIQVEAGQEIEPNNLVVLADSIGHFRIFLTTKAQQQARSDIVFVVENISGDEKSGDSVQSVFVSKAK